MSKLLDMEGYYTVKRLTELNKYKYSGFFNPVCSQTKIVRFEENYKIKLPEIYVDFLMKIGNGGKGGPFCGLFSLKEIERYNVHLNKTVLSEGIFNTYIDSDRWVDITETFKKNRDILFQIYKNSLVIGIHGNSYETLLICSGDLSGQIVYLNTDFNRDYPPIYVNLSFDEWLVNYFVEKDKGYDTSLYGFCKIGDESDFINEFQIANSDSERHNLLKSFRKFPEVSTETLDFLKSIRDVEYFSEVTQLLFKFDLVGAEGLVRELFSTNASLDINYLMKLPDKYKYLFYNDAIIFFGNGQLNRESTTSLLEFVDRCSSKKIEDILSVVSFDTILELDLYGEFISVIFDCNDMLKYLDLFCYGLEKDDYNIKVTIIRGLIKAHCFDDKIVGVINQIDCSNNLSLYNEINKYNDMYNFFCKK